MKFMITFTHIEGAWESLDEDTRQHHTQWLNEFMQALRREKQAELVFVAPPAETTTVRKQADGSVDVLEGPAFDGPEFLGGYYIIEADSQEEALEWARRGRELIGSNEVRQILEFDF